MIGNVNNNPWRIRSHLNPDEAKQRTNTLIQHIKRPTITLQVEKEVDYSPVFPVAVVKDPLPVICILNGAGAGGKGTFVQLVDNASINGAIELSTIDPCRSAAEILLQCSEDLAVFCRNGQVTARDIIDEKGDQYRQFLHDIKRAWDKVDHASQRYGIAEIMKILNEHIEVSLSAPELCWDFDDAKGFSGTSVLRALEKIYTFPASEEYEIWMSRKNMIVTFRDHLKVESHKMPSIIFMNIREPENIKRFQDECFDIGLLCFTLLIDGRTSIGVWENDADTHVDEYQYDIVINNKLDIDSLSTSAFVFAKFVERANSLYGVSTSTAIEYSIMGKYFSNAEETEASK